MQVRKGRSSRIRVDGFKKRQGKKVVRTGIGMEVEMTRMWIVFVESRAHGQCRESHGEDERKYHAASLGTWC